MKIQFISRIFFSLLTAAFLTVALTAFAFGQAANNQSLPENKLTVDEDFELNITEDRIVETNFERSTSVELNDQSRGALSVRVGVGVGAERIDVLLRGIFGRVRFRASLEPIRQRIERLQTIQEKANAPK